MPSVSASASALTRAVLTARTSVTAQVRGTFSLATSVTALVVDRSKVGFVRAPAITDPTKTALNITLNAAYNRVLTAPDGSLVNRPGWTALAPGPVTRYEFGQGGALRVLTAVTTPPTAEGDPLAWVPGLGDSAYEALGSFVRRDGTTSMGGTLTHADAATNATKGQLGWSSGWYGLTVGAGNDLRLAAPSGKKVQFRTNDTERGYFNDSGLTVVGTLDVSGLATFSGLGGFGNLRLGNHPVHGSGSPGLWNSANVLGTNFALLAEANSTIVNAVTAVTLRIGNADILGVATAGITLASGKTITVPGATSTYGGVTIDGAKAGYSGINFRSGGSIAATLMVSTDGVYQGFYNAADNAWLWYWASGTLTAGTVPVARVSGLANSATITAATTNTASQIVQRDGSGDIYTGRISATNNNGTNDQANFLLNDIWTYRSGSTNTGSLYLNSARDRHLQYNGTAYTLVGASVIVNGTTYTSSRDYKRDIRDVADPSALVLALRVRHFRYRDDHDADDRERTGFIYEEVRERLPEAVSEADLLDGGTVKSVDYSTIYALAFRALQAQIARGDALERRVAALETLVGRGR